VTTTTRRAPIEVAEPAGAPSSAAIADLITNAPVPRPTLVKTFNAMMAREFRVLRRNAVATFTRAVMQPLLFVFVFAYVFPKIGGGFNLGGGAAAEQRENGDNRGCEPGVHDSPPWVLMQSRPIPSPRRGSFRSRYWQGVSPPRS